MTTSTVKNNSEPLHNLILENRKKVVLSGVLEVVSFEEDSVQLKTTKGDLTIRGENLKMESYVSNVGDLTILGNIYALVYLNDSEKKSSFLNRLFK